MQQAGVSVFAADSAGFGKSEPSEEKYRCFVANVDYFADDIYTFRKVFVTAPLHVLCKIAVMQCQALSLRCCVQEIVSQHCKPEVPVFMGGVSMGGMISVLTVLRDTSAWKASSFFLHSLVASRHRAMLYPESASND